MSRYSFAALLLFIAGCASRKAPVPAIVVAPTAIPTATPIFVAVPPMPTPATPTPDPERVRMQAIVVRELERLKSASPDQDVATAWANKDTRFLGVYGYSLSLPGVPTERSRAAVMRGKVNPIQGTTDSAQSNEQAELNDLAWKYATRYNQLLLAKLDEQTNATAN